LENELHKLRLADGVCTVYPNSVNRDVAALNYRLDVDDSTES